MTDDANDNVDPVAEGFRQPPKRFSLSCFSYMGRIIELRSFVSVFFGAVRGSDETKKLIKQLSPDDFRYKLPGYNLVRYNYSQHRQFMNEVMLSRAVETFDLYLIGILREIFLSKPDMLKSEAPVDASTLIELRSFDDIVAHIAEKKLHELSYKPLSELRSYIASRTGLDLFKDNDTYETIILASEIRNLIAHNDCRSNELFLRRIKSIRNPQIETREKDGKIIINDNWIRRTSYILDSVVFDFDEAATGKFPLNADYTVG